MNEYYISWLEKSADQLTISYPTIYVPALLMLFVVLSLFTFTFLRSHLRYLSFLNVLLSVSILSLFQSCAPQENRLYSALNAPLSPAENPMDPGGFFPASGDEKISKLRLMDSAGSIFGSVGFGDPNPNDPLFLSTMPYAWYKPVDQEPYSNAEGLLNGFCQQYIMQKYGKPTAAIPHCTYIEGSAESQSILEGCTGADKKIYLGQGFVLGNTTENSKMRVSHGTPFYVPTYCLDNSENYKRIQLLNPSAVQLLVYGSGGSKMSVEKRQDPGWFVGILFEDSGDDSLPLFTQDKLSIGIDLNKDGQISGANEIKPLQTLDVLVSSSEQNLFNRSHLTGDFLTDTEEPLYNAARYGPVVLANGELSLSHVDHIYGNLTIARTYRSLTSNTLGSFGRGWHFGFERARQWFQRSDTYQKFPFLKSGEGRLLPYSNEIFFNPDDPMKPLETELERAGRLSPQGGDSSGRQDFPEIFTINGSLVAQGPSYDRLYLFYAGGQLKLIADEVAWRGGQLPLLVDKLKANEYAAELPGNALWFTYNDAGLISSIRDKARLNILYSYGNSAGGDRLQKVSRLVSKELNGGDTDKETTIYEYGYEDYDAQDWHGLLTSVSSFERKSVIENVIYDKAESYYGGSPVVKSLDLNGTRIQYDYDFDRDDKNTSLVTVRDFAVSYQNVLEYTLDHRGMTTKVEGPTKSAESMVLLQRTIDDKSLQTKVQISRDRIKTIKSYNNRGSLVRTTNCEVLAEGNAYNINDETCQGFASRSTDLTYYKTSYLPNYLDFLSLPVPSSVKAAASSISSLGTQTRDTDYNYLTDLGGSQKKDCSWGPSASKFLGTNQSDSRCELISSELPGSMPVAKVTSTEFFDDGSVKGWVVLKEGEDPSLTYNQFNQMGMFNRVSDVKYDTYWTPNGFRTLDADRDYTKIFFDTYGNPLMAVSPFGGGIEDRGIQKTIYDYSYPSSRVKKVLESNNRLRGYRADRDDPKHKILSKILQDTQYLGYNVTAQEDLETAMGYGEYVTSPYRATMINTYDPISGRLINSASEGAPEREYFYDSLGRNSRIGSSYRNIGDPNFLINRWSDVFFGYGDRVDEFRDELGGSQENAYTNYDGSVSKLTSTEPVAGKDDLITTTTVEQYDSLDRPLEEKTTTVGDSIAVVETVSYKYDTPFGHVSEVRREKAGKISYEQYFYETPAESCSSESSGDDYYGVVGSIKTQDYLAPASSTNCYSGFNDQFELLKAEQVELNLMNEVVGNDDCNSGTPLNCYTDKVSGLRIFGPEQLGGSGSYKKYKETNESYDGLGNIVESNDLVTTDKVQYAYDVLGRPLSLSHPDRTVKPVYYDVDAFGNVIFTSEAEFANYNQGSVASLSLSGTNEFFEGSVSQAVRNSDFSFVFKDLGAFSGRPQGWKWWLEDRHVAVTNPISEKAIISRQGRNIGPANSDIIGVKRSFSWNSSTHALSSRTKNLVTNTITEEEEAPYQTKVKMQDERSQTTHNYDPLTGSEISQQTNYTDYFDGARRDLVGKALTSYDIFGRPLEVDQKNEADPSRSYKRNTYIYNDNFNRPLPETSILVTTLPSNRVVTTTNYFENPNVSVPQRVEKIVKYGDQEFRSKSTGYTYNGLTNLIKSEFKSVVHEGQGLTQEQSAPQLMSTHSIEFNSKGRLGIFENKLVFDPVEPLEVFGQDYFENYPNGDSISFDRKPADVSLKVQYNYDDSTFVGGGQSGAPAKMVQLVDLDDPGHNVMSWYMGASILNERYRDVQLIKIDSKEIYKQIPRSQDTEDAVMRFSHIDQTAGSLDAETESQLKLGGLETPPRILNNAWNDGFYEHFVDDPNQNYGLTKTIENVAGKEPWDSLFSGYNLFFARDDGPERSPRLKKVSVRIPNNPLFIEREEVPRSRQDFESLSERRSCDGIRSNFIKYVNDGLRHGWVKEGGEITDTQGNLKPQESNVLKFDENENVSSVMHSVNHYTDDLFGSIDRLYRVVTNTVYDQDKNPVLDETLVYYRSLVPGEEAYFEEKLIRVIQKINVFVPAPTGALNRFHILYEQRIRDTGKVNTPGHSISLGEDQDLSHNYQGTAWRYLYGPGGPIMRFEATEYGPSTCSNIEYDQTGNPIAMTYSPTCSLPQPGDLPYEIRYYSPFGTPIINVAKQNILFGNPKKVHVLDVRDSQTFVGSDPRYQPLSLSFGIGGNYFNGLLSNSNYHPYTGVVLSPDEANSDSVCAATTESIKRAAYSSARRIGVNDGVRDDFKTNSEADLALFEKIDDALGLNSPNLFDTVLGYLNKTFYSDATGGGSFANRYQDTFPLGVWLRADPEIFRLPLMGVNPFSMATNISSAYLQGGTKGAMLSVAHEFAINAAIMTGFVAITRAVPYAAAFLNSVDKPLFALGIGGAVAASFIPNEEDGPRYVLYDY